MSTLDYQLSGDWQQDFEQILGVDQNTEKGEPLALQLNGGIIEPLRLDSNASWTTARASWRDLTSRWASVTQGLRTDHLSLLRNLYNSSASTGLSIKKLTPEAGKILLEASEAGINIYADTSRTSTLKIYTEAAQPRLQPVYGKTNDELVIKVTLLVGQSTVPAEHVQILPGNWAAWIASRKCIVFLDKWAKSPGMEQLGAALLNKQTWTISCQQAPEFWVYHFERLRQMQLITAEDTANLQIPTYGLPTLMAQFTLHPENPHTIKAQWYVQRKSSNAKDLTYPFVVSKADAQLRSYAKRVTTAAGMKTAGIKNDSWGRFFTQNYPLWELPALRTLPEKLKPLGVKIQFSPEVERIEIHNRLTSLELILKEEETEDNATNQSSSQLFELRLKATVGKHKLDTQNFLSALRRKERWFEVNDDQWLDLYDFDLQNMSKLLSAVTETSSFYGDKQAVNKNADINNEKYNEQNNNAEPSDLVARICLLQTGLIEQLGQLTHMKTSPQWKERVKLLSDGSSLKPIDVKGAKWRSYQLYGLQWMIARAQARLGGILADDMGLGKTWQVLGAVATLKKAGQLKGPVLVVAPSSVVSTWSQVARQWFPKLNVVTQNSTFSRSGTTLEKTVKNVDIFITTYTLIRLESQVYKNWSWEGLVVDEAQFVKNPSTSAYKVLSHIKANWRFALSGTPIENSLIDLWSLTNLVTPGLLPSQKVFERRWMGAAPQEKQTSLLKRVAPFLLRRTKEKVAKELPKKIEQVIEIQLEKEHQALYNKFLTNIGEKISSENNQMHILAALTRARQLALSPQILDKTSQIEGAKTAWLRQHIPQLTQLGHSILIFSQFTSYLGLLRTIFDDMELPYSYLDGTTKNREGAVEEFRSENTKIFLISLKAGGFGLTLTEADYVFLCDPWWNPAAEAQAIDRAHRIGQEKPVNVYRLIAKHTVEERVMKLQESKKEIAAQALSGQENPQNDPTLSIEQLKRLLAL